MKMTTVSLLEIAPVSLTHRLAHEAGLEARRANRRSRPRSPPAGSGPPRRSTTTTSTALDRTSNSQISSACSPVSGWETSISSHVDADALGPGGVERMLGVDERRHPSRVSCALPRDRQRQAWSCPTTRGRKISTMRPRGTPRPPNARSRRQRSGRECRGWSCSGPLASPGFMMEPEPKFFSIWPRGRAPGPAAGPSRRRDDVAPSVRLSSLASGCGFSASRSRLVA